LSVPGCFDVAQPFFGKRGTGCYRRTVRTGGNIRLFIDGLGVEGEVYWDGVLIGKCPYAYMPEKFNFNAGEYKDHELVIAVSNCFNKVFFPYFDFYAYGGIFGSVKIEELPAYRIDLTKVTTLDYTTGRISVDVEVNKFFRKAKEIIFEIDGKTVLSADFAGKKNVYEISVPDFKLWSPEEPNLHKMRIILGEYEEEFNFGIRTFEAKGTQLFTFDISEDMVGSTECVIEVVAEATVEGMSSFNNRAQFNADLINHQSTRGTYDSNRDAEMVTGERRR
jgi:beta-galactosidase/beta-glucuronidase